MTMPNRTSAFLFSLLLLATSVFSQTFRGTIAGNIADASGAAVPGASVKIINDATGITREATTGPNGDFSIPDLNLGLYTVTISRTGFQTTKVDKVEVVVSRTTNLPIKLAIASQATTVEISAAIATVETSSTTLANVVNSRAVSDMPMNGRDFRQMLKLAPGVTPSSTSVNGMRTSGNNYQIDGADNNDAFHNSSAVNQGGVNGIAGTLLPVEAIDQFALATNAGADQGRNGGANVNLVIKSGTNALHGSLYYFNRNEALALRTPFQQPTDPKRKIRNDQYGFSVGGPIIKNKTFFFITGEKQKSIAALGFLTTHPSAAWVDQAKGVLSRYNLAVNPVMTNLLTFWPSRYNALPATINNLVAGDQAYYDSYNGIIKLDHNFSDRHSVAVRYFGGTGVQIADNGVPYHEYFQVAPSRMHNISVVQSSTLSPTMLNQVILGVNYFKQTFNDFDTSPNPIAAGLNTGVTNPTLIGSPTLRISNFSGASATQPLGRIDTTGHFTDNFSWTRGSHQVKIGGEYRRAVLDVFYDTNKRGSFSFDGTRGPWSADSSVSSQLKSLSDFLVGYPTNSAGATIVQGQLQRYYLQNSFDWWAHDNWQVNRKLNFNFGVRYTYHGPLYDDKNSITNFVPGKGILQLGKDLSSLYPRDLNNFAPRFGFAYQPGQDSKTVIRGSYGIYYDVPPLNFIVANTGIPNAGAAGVQANPGGADPVYSISRTDNLVIQSGVPIFGGTAPKPPFGVFSVSQDFRTPYVQNFNLNVQRQLNSNTVFQIGYVGSLGHKLSLLRNINAATPGPVATAQLRRPFNTAFPTYAAINELNSIANSNYNSLQTQLRVTRWKNFTGVANYTWGHALDNGSNVRNSLPANSYDLRREYGNASFDVRQIFTGFLTYDIPVFTTRYKRLLQGWQLNTLVTYQTGEPIDLLRGSNISGAGDNRDRVNLIGNPYANIPTTKTDGTALARGTQYLFNPNAFASAPAGEFGNIGRNVLYGPKLGAVDFSVFKTTNITERVSVQFRAEIFNLFNRLNYAAPGTNFASFSTLGLQSNTRNGSGAPGLGFGEPRNAQLALKIIF